MSRKSDFQHAREQRGEKHGGGCCLPAFIIGTSFMAIAGGCGLLIKMVLAA